MGSPTGRTFGDVVSRQGNAWNRQRAYSPRRFASRGVRAVPPNSLAAAAPGAPASLVAGSSSQDGAQGDPAPEAFGPGAGRPADAQPWPSPAGRAARRV